MITRQRIVIALLLVLALAASAYAITLWQDTTDTSARTPNSTNDSAVQTGPVTLTGVTVCLEAVNKSDVSIQSCAIGLKAAGGKQYAIKTTNSEDMLLTSGQTGKPLRISGTVTKSPNSLYDIVGVIEVEKAEEL